MDILKWFIENFPSYVKKMKKCSYHFNEKKLNNHHLEGDVWSHTILSFSKAIEKNMPNHILWAVLLHDIGRIYTRTKYDKHVDFGDFEGVSCYVVLDVLNKTQLDQIEKIRILKIISYHYTMINHMKFNNPSIEDLKEKFKYEEELLKDLALYCQCDLEGRIIEKSRQYLYQKDKIEQSVRDILSIKQKTSSKSKKKNNLYILVGPPCSGKSSWIKNYKDTVNTIVINRDACVLEVGKKYKKHNYDESFDLMHDNEKVKKEIDNLDESKENIAKSTTTKDVIIDNPNLKSSNRKEWIDELKETHNIKVILFLTSYKELNRRNKKRNKKEKKSITKKGFIRKLKTFTFPLLSEGIDFFEYKVK